MTIGLGHLELLRRLGGDVPEVDVAADELRRIERIVERLLLLAKADQPDFVVPDRIELERFLEDVFVRWSDVVPRPWKLGPLPSGTLEADAEALRHALDALLENAVKHTDASGQVELRARQSGEDIVIEVADEGEGIPPDTVGRIFDRFARVDDARTRNGGGVGLGLAIVDTIARAHGGDCSVRTSASGSTFVLRLPRFRATAVPASVVE